jgi:hypothetical protein
MNARPERSAPRPLSDWVSSMPGGSSDDAKPDGARSRVTASGWATFVPCSRTWSPIQSI